MIIDIVIVGASGLGKEILQLLIEINQKKNIYNILGFVDDNTKLKGKLINNHKVLGGTEYFETSVTCSVVIAISNPKIKNMIVNKINNYNINHQFPNIIHPNVHIDLNSNKIGIGNIITEGFILTSDINIGNYNTFNTRTTLGHDVSIGDFNTLNPNVQISGNVIIGSYNFIAVNSVILQGITVGNHNHIGACSLVIKNLKNEMNVFGIPAQKLKF